MEITEDTFVTADHHFGHKNIIKYENRPYEDVQEMNRALITRWNELVSPDDYVLHLGDFSLTSAVATTEIISELNGTIDLIKGNHDRGHSDAWWMRAGINKVLGTTTATINGATFVFTHEPLDMNLSYPTAVNIHGHIHSRAGRLSYPVLAHNRVCVSVELTNWAPIRIIDIMEKLYSLYYTRYEELFKNE